MVVQDVVVESCIADSKARKLPGVPITIPTALNRSLDKPMLQKLLIEELGVPAQVANKVADLRTDARVVVLDQHIQIAVDIRIVDRLVEVFAYPSQLGDQRQRINDQRD